MHKRVGLWIDRKKAVIVSIADNIEGKSIITSDMQNYVLYSTIVPGDGSPENIGGAWRALGLVAGKTGKAIRIKEKETGASVDYDARACFAKSEKIFAESEISGEQARTLREWARHELRMDNRDQAIKMWENAREIFAKLGADMEVQRMNEQPE